MGTNLEMGFVRLRRRVSEAAHRRGPGSWPSARIVRARFGGHRSVLLVPRTAKQGERRCAHRILDVPRQWGAVLDTALLRPATLGTGAAAARHYLRFSAPPLFRSSADFPDPFGGDRIGTAMDLDRPQTGYLV